MGFLCGHVSLSVCVSRAFFSFLFLFCLFYSIFVYLNREREKEGMNLDGLGGVERIWEEMGEGKP